MDASVVVCTYNRAASLAGTLDCLLAQVTPADLAWEILVVDNNSSDGTPELVGRYRAHDRRIRYAFQGEQGLSHARNLGIELARGELLLFTDDDVCPEPDWVAVMVAAMRETGCDAAGGYVAPVWEVPPPAWLTPRLYGYLAVRTDSEADYPIREPKQAPFGANMAVRRSVFGRVGAFDVSRGRKGAVLASGEDGELFQRILAAGMDARFFARARVHHKIEAFRLTKGYFRRWRYQASRNIAISRGLPGSRRLFGVPLYLFPQTVRALARTLTGYLRLPPDEAFHREIIFWHFLGTIAGLYAARNSSSG